MILDHILCLLAEVTGSVLVVSLTQPVQLCRAKDRERLKLSDVSLAQEEVPESLSSY